LLAMSFLPLSASAFVYTNLEVEAICYISKKKKKNKDMKEICKCHDFPLCQCIFECKHQISMIDDMNRN
jgi:hypothetical protein